MTDSISSRYLLEEYAERIVIAKNIPDVIDYNFVNQANFLKDPYKRKALFCTRRSAKSYTAGLGLVKTALEFAGCNCLFIGLTRASAEAIIWKDVLKIINEKHSLKADFNESRLRMRLPNSSEITLTGVDVSEDEMKKLLGRKFKLIAIDEASMYTISIQNLIDLIEPATVDENGSIWLMGTASNFPRGIFYDISNRMRKDWKLFEWTAHDNPYVSRQWKAAIKKIEEERPEYMETPQFKQWYLNKWVIDEEKLVYRFSMQRNLCKALPLALDPSGWTFVLGVDTGWEDDSAFVLTAYHMHDTNLYVMNIFKKKKMTFDEVAEKIEDYMKNSLYAPNIIIIDGANKQGVESMRQRSNIPFQYADKTDKATFIELCNSDLIQGKIKIIDVPENRPLWEEMSALIWVSEGDKIKYPKKEHPALPNHCTDAFLYAWRCGFHFSATKAPKKIVTGSREWYQAQSEDIWDRERERLMEDQNDWGIEGTLGDLSEIME